MNSNPAATVNTKAVLAVIAVALVVATLFGSSTPVPDSQGVSQVATR